MGRITVQKAHRLAGLVFVGAVTVCLLAFVFEQATRGLSGLPGVLVYSFAAGFGLEFLGSAWTGRFSGTRKELGPGSARW